MTPPPAADPRRYEGYVEHYFATNREFSRPHYDSLRPAFRSYFSPFLPNNKNARIADLACGAGEFLYFLQHEGYRETRGVDALATQVSAATAAGVTGVELGDARTWLAQSGGAFDLISAHDFLEHLPPDETVEFLRQIREALKPGGTLLVSTPNAESPFAGRSRYCDFTHRTSFTPSSLRHVLLSAGFKEIQVFAKEPVAHSLRGAVRLLLWKAIKQMIGAYLLAETGTRGSGVFTQVMYAVATRDA